MDVVDAVVQAFTGPQPWAHPLVKYYFCALLSAYPAWRISRRAGFRGWAALWLAVPFFGVVLLTLSLALRRWPVSEGGAA